MKKKNDLEPVTLKKDTPSHYTLRYLPGVDMHRRTHAETVGNWPSWVDAEDARQALPSGKAEELEVVRR
jgi:hypothetical protein